jgi:hypothetical protein
MTRTPTRTFTPLLSRTSTRTRTPSITRTPTRTFTPSLSRTSTRTRTPSITRTPTQTPTQVITPTPSAPDDWQTYTDQTYGFTFRYPAEGQIVNQQDHSARISLPFMPGTNLTEKFIDVVVMENADPCVSQNPGVSQSQLLTVNGIPFLEESGADSGAGHSYEWIAYSTSKNNVCASLTFVLNSTNPSFSTNPPPPFDKPAESDVFAHILATFAWPNR